MKELTQIANEFYTDKGTTTGECHSFTEFYDEYFKQYIGKPINILEIGVWNGGSLKMYETYFNGNCKIYGLDIEDKSHLDNKNIKTFVVDQGSRIDLQAFKETIGDTKFDIILDDGSHIPQHQQLTLYYFSDLLTENGIYILEDLHTWVWSNIENSPLFSLAFNKPFTCLTPEENNILKNRISTSTIWSNFNEKSPSCSASITAILTMNK